MSDAGLAGSVAVEIGGNLAPLEAALAKAEQLTRAFDTRVAQAMSGTGVSSTMAQVSAAVDKSTASITKITAPASAAAAQIDKVEMSGVGAAVSAKAMAAALEATGGDLSKITPAMLGLAAAQTEVAGTAEVATVATAEMGAAQAKSAGFTAGVSREFSVLGSEILRGNFSRIPGSLLVMNERLASTGTGALNLKNLFGAIGSAASVAFNPTILAFIGITTAIDLIARNIGGLSGGFETATEALKRHGDELKTIVAGYDQATKAVDDYIGNASRLPAGAALSDLQQQFKDATDAIAKFRAYTAVEGTPGADDFSFMTDDMKKLVVQFNAGTLSASDLVTKLTELKNSNLGPLGFMMKPFIDSLADAARKAGDLQNAIVGFEHIAVGLNVQGGLQNSLEQKIAGTSSANAYQADLAAITALSPAAQADVARRQKELELRDQNLTAGRRQQEIDQAGVLAYTQAAHALSMADQQRLMAANENIKSAQVSLDTIGMSVGKTQELTFARQQLSAAETAAAQNGVTVSAAYIAQVEKLAAAYGAVQQKIAEVTALNDAKFNSQMLGLNSGDQSIAQTLHGIYGNDWQSQMNGTIANQLRLNAALADFKQTAEDASNTFVSTFVSDLRQGQGAAASFGDALVSALDQVAQKLVQMAIDNLWSNAFGGATGGSSGNWLSSLLGMFTGAASGGTAGNFSIGGMARYASGTNSSIGGMALVGEQGPELVRLPAGSQVSTASQTRSIFGRAGGTSISLNPVYNISGTGLSKDEILALMTENNGSLLQAVNDQFPAAIASISGAGTHRQRGGFFK